MKILSISGHQLFPPFTGGHLRLTSLLTALANDDADVCLYSFCGRAEQYKAKEPSGENKIGKNLVEYINRGLFFGILQFVTRKCKLPRFWQVIVLGRLCYPDYLKDKIKWADVIIFDEPYLYPLVKKYPEKRWFMSSQNVEHRLWQRTKFQRILISPIVKLIEKRSAKYAHGILCCTDEDRDFFQGAGNPNLNLEIVPNGIFPEKYKRNDNEREIIRKQYGYTEDTKVLLFSGSRYQPNIDAFEMIKNFEMEHREFLRNSGYVFLVVGRVSNEKIETDTLVVTSAVDDILGYFSAADFSLNPVVQGSGSSLKTYEALAAGLPMISSAFGVRGFDLTPGEDYYLIDQKGVFGILEELLDVEDGFHDDMAKRAFRKNRKIVDVTYIAKNTVVPFLVK